MNLCSVCYKPATKNHKKCVQLIRKEYEDLLQELYEDNLSARMNTKIFRFPVKRGRPKKTN